VTVYRALAGRQEDLPLLALRVLDPALFAVRVTTGRRALFEHRTIDAPQAGVQVLKFLAALGLYPQVPSRAELVLASPRFSHIEIRRGDGRRMTIDAPGA